MLTKRTAVNLAVLMALPLLASSTAASPACANRVNDTQAKLLECVTLEGVREHQMVFQDIADANGGIRASGTIGYDATVDYVAGMLEDAGYDVTIQSFDFQTFINLSPALVELISPPPAGPVDNSIFTFSGSGDVTAPVTAQAGDDSFGKHMRRRISVREEGPEFRKSSLYCKGSGKRRQRPAECSGCNSLEDQRFGWMW